MDSFANFVKTSTRPFLVVLFSISLVACVFESITPPTWFLTLALAVIGEWPVERAVIRVKERK